MDKEHEIDEFVRGAIKDQESERKLKELYEKAYGLDVVKPKFHETRERYKAMQEQYNGLAGAVGELNGFLKRNDLDGFFGALNIPQEKIFQYVHDKLNYEGLPPEQRAAVDRQRELEQRAYLQERQIQSLQQTYEQQAVQARTFELDSVLNRADVKSQAEAFDARVGKPGAFKAEAIRRGVMAYYTTGQDITPEQAVKEVLGLLGPTLQTHAAPAMAAPGASQSQMVPPSKAQEKPPVLPNVSGRSTSPAKKAPRSVEDLRRMAREIGE